MSDQVTKNEAAALGAEREMRERLEALTEEQQKQLSQALFPSTHTTKVQVCGKERSIQPLKIKFARQLNVKLQAFHSKVAEGADENKVVDVGMLDTVLEAALVVAEAHAWEDVIVAINDEDVELSELQALLVQQVNLQESNDFLLMPLRILVVVMQRAEIETIHLQSTYSGRH